MEQNLKLSDSVLARIVQIIQEAMLLGVDCVDLLRQIRVKSDESDASALVLTPEYQKMVKEHHEKLLAEAEKLKNDENNVKKFLINVS